MKPKVCVIIPARYNASRFPGKLLYDILGKSVLQRTYEQVKKASLVDNVLIATDSKKISDHAATFSARSLMTSPDCPTGSDRIIEAVEKHAIDADYIVNVQGDEPCISPDTIDAVITKITENDSVVLATAACPIKKSEAENPSVVKVVVDNNDNALYFSRALIPYPYKNTTSFLQHLGIYAFKREFLFRFKELPESSHQKIEDLEQLKVLDHGYKIAVVKVTNKSPHVDEMGDIEKVIDWLCKRQNTSL